MKKAVKIPVATVGGITMPDEAESILAEGKVDAIALGRALLADPEWPEKVRTGRAEEIVPCLRCISCYHVATQHRSTGCAVNPRMGREARLDAEYKPVTSRKHVVVVGGGPGGMKAALTAAGRGHRVTLLEKEKELGGIIRVAEYDDKKIDLRNYGNYLVNRVNSSAIKVMLNTEATPDMVKGLKPDAVIVAVGSQPAMPPVPGIDSPGVLLPVEAYENLERLGKRVVIIGGGQVGCELGLSVAGSGRDVTVIEVNSIPVKEGNLIYREAMRQKIEAEPKLTIYLEERCKAITSRGVVVEDKTGRERTIGADNIICATGMKPLKELAESFYGIVYDTWLIGDCVSARRVNEATHEGFFSAMAL
jgi:NADPH-dependent 2,4-dienoyl-CoA reductase/sulfur reductase-like enzyme